MAERSIGEGRWLRGLLILAALLVIVLLLGLPLALVFAQALAEGAGAALAALARPESLAAIRLTLLVAAIVVPVNVALGIAVAWAVAYHRFPGRLLLRALTGLPFAVSPVVAGLATVLLFGKTGWLGPWLEAHGLQVVFALPGMVLATLFVTIPLVAGQILPSMLAHGPAEEEAALTLGAGAWSILWLVTLPRERWALAFAVLLCNARAMGEFGAVAVVSGRIRGLTTTMPLLVEAAYQEYDMVGAFALAALLALLALLTVAARALLEGRQRRAERLGSEARLAA